MRRCAALAALVFLVSCGGTAPAATTVPDVGPTQTQGVLAAQVGTLTAQNAALQSTVSAPTATVAATATTGPTVTPPPAAIRTPVVVTSVPRTVAPTAVPTQATAAKIGETATGQGFTVTIHEAIDNAPRSQFTAPKEGFRWIAFDVTIANTGRAKLAYNPGFFRIKAADNREYNVNYSGVEPKLAFGDHQPGESSRGWVTLEVPVDAAMATLTYTPPGSIGRVMFDVR